MFFGSDNEGSAYENGVVKLKFSFSDNFSDNFFILLFVWLFKSRGAHTFQLASYF